MSDLPDNLTPQQWLAALADGEGDPATHPEAIKAALSTPQAAEQMLQQVALRRAVSRVMADTAEPSAHLQTKITALADQWIADQGLSSGDSDESNGSAGSTKTAAAPRGVGDEATEIAEAVDDSSRRIIRPWWSRPTYALAAGIALLGSGLWLGRYLNHESVDTNRVVVVPPNRNPSTRLSGPIVPVSLASFVTRTHVGCSRSHAHHGLAMPPSVADLEQPIRTYLGGDTLQPDLSAMGYTYVGCGPCGRPHEKLVHFLYQKESPEGTDTLSLFVEPFKDQVNIKPGRSYTGNSAESAHPMIIWRTDDLLFMLVGNAAEPVEKARQALKAPSRV